MCRSHLLFEKRHHSVQASINPTDSNYRRAGQVTGLLFRSFDDIAHPDLIGQWTGAGPVYNFDEAERILDLVVMTTAKPRRKVMVRSALSQVVSIMVVTNARKIHLGPRTADVCDQLMSRSENSIREVFWDFNAMFDRLRCVYN